MYLIDSTLNVLSPAIGNLLNSVTNYYLLNSRNRNKFNFQIVDCLFLQILNYKRNRHISRGDLQGWVSSPIRALYKR